MSDSENAAQKAVREAEEKIKMNVMSFLLWFALFIGAWCAAMEISQGMKGKASPFGFFKGDVNQKQRAENESTHKPLLNSEKEVLNLGTGMVQEVVKAKCGAILVRMTFESQKGMSFGAIASEEMKVGDTCKIIILNHFYGDFPLGQPTYIAVKVDE